MGIPHVVIEIVSAAGGRARTIRNASDLLAREADQIRSCRPDLIRILKTGVIAVQTAPDIAAAAEPTLRKTTCKRELQGVVDALRTRYVERSRCSGDCSDLRQAPPGIPVDVSFAPIHQYSDVLDGVP